ncbi:MFS transporter [Nocardia sp. ET3-3]|uniref:MFS transporter n=1 Tax=Nocardia terrae TaxID=2675851 RepID=A0A7K1V5F5_9NOCA|nr:MFS transporter [Nocardia terrae]MVU81712.1 MFS transporter [Nocardia terrae]
MRTLPLAVWALVIAAFAMGADEFVVAGVVEEIADSLHVSLGAVGRFESAYALGVAIGAPLFTAIGGRVSRRFMLLATTGVFLVGNTLSLLGPTYDVILSGRVIAALAHGAFFGIAALFAAELVSKGKQGRAIATVFAGSTAATILGAPIGAAVGRALGWRATFGTLVLFGLLAALGLILLIPRTIGRERARTVADGTHDHAHADGHAAAAAESHGHAHAAIAVVAATPGGYSHAESGSGVAGVAHAPSQASVESHAHNHSHATAEAVGHAAADFGQHMHAQPGSGAGHDHSAGVAAADSNVHGHSHGAGSADETELDAHARMHMAGGGSAPLPDQLRALRRPAVWIGLLTTLLGYGGVFTSYVYLAPQLTEATGLGKQWVTPMFLIFGAGLFAGNQLGGKLADRNLRLALVVSVGSLAVTLFALTLLIHNPVTAALGLLAYGVAAFSVVAPLQLRVMQKAGDAPDIASAANISAFTLGSALGIWLGGAAIDGGLGVTSVNWVGGSIAVAGLALTLISLGLDRVIAPEPFEGGPVQLAHQH